MFGFLAKKKAYSAAVNDKAAELVVEPGDNLLNAALRSGLQWPHNCRVGSCGTCRCRLISGSIKPLNDFSYVLDPDELDKGMILACQTSLRSDIEVAVELEGSDQRQTSVAAVAGTVAQNHSLTHDINEIVIQLDDALPPYLAGQYAEVSVAGIDQPRSYSFARAPALESENQVRFFVRHVPGGEMSGWFHAQSRVGEPVSVSGPYGSFYLRPGDSPILCIAGGSGLAPVKALLEQLEGDGFSRSVSFLFGARSERDLYCTEQLEALQQAQSGQFRFVPVLSEEPDDSAWAGERGMVTDLIAPHLANADTCETYLCGPPGMIDRAIELLTGVGIPPERIYFDKFLDASHLPDGRR